MSSPVQHPRIRLIRLTAAVIVVSSSLSLGQNAGTSSSTKHNAHSTSTDKTSIDPGSILNGVYRNSTLRLSCKIPAGWVLRTEEMNAPDEKPSGQNPAESSTSHSEVLLAAF